METALKYKIQKADRQLFVKMVIPVLIESVINTLFGIMDTAMLGRVENASRAISAVGITGSLINMFIVLAAAFAVGFSAQISQNYGAHKYHLCHEITAQMMPIFAAIGVVMTAAMSFGAPLLVRFLGANSEIFDEAVTYMRIIGYGMFFHIMAIAVTASFRGIGQTKLPMFYNLAAGVINVFFNYCLINGHLGFPALEVRGAAIATTISKAVMFVAAMVALYRMDTIVRLRVKDKLLPQKETIMPSVRLGVSALLEQIILQGGNVLTTKIISVIETVPYAAYSVSLSMESMVWAISGSYGTVSTTLAGMAKGEKNYAKAKSYVGMILKVGMTTAAALALCYFFFGETLAGFYTDEAVVKEMTGDMLKLFSVMLFGIFTTQTVAGAMRGMGYMKYPLIASLISLWACRVFGCLITVRVLSLGVMWVVICCTGDQLVRAAINVYYYINKFCKKASLE